MKTLTALAIGLFCIMASPVLATAVGSSGVLTVDNTFAVYLSTDDSVAGVQVAAGLDWTQWSTAQTFSNVPLTPNVTNYIHVYAENYIDGQQLPNDPVRNPAAFLGEFHLSGGGFQFADGSTQLLTNAGLFNESQIWKVSTQGWGIWDSTVTSFGANGVSPWGTVGGITPDAEWIWTSDEWETPRYFSATIEPTHPEERPNVPEASTLMLALCGLSSISGALRLRRK